ncbi:DUF6318 family protein [Cellulosimicrobium composti]|uniref:DUF6318 family protein n=1 Tax=Cellulosimicrobium composti TaxID=2672572 RepID=UPI00378D89E0
MTLGGGGRRSLLAVGIVVAGCLVAACTGGGEPDPTPPVETSVAPSPTPTPEPTETGPTKPERPAAMDRDDAEGAGAAAEYFLRLYSPMMTSKDSADWEAMSHAECGYCSASLEKVRWLEEADGTYAGGDITLEIEDPSKYTRDEQTGLFPLDGVLAQEALVVTDAEGRTVASEPATTMNVRVEVGRSNANWVIVEIAPRPGGDVG